MKLGEFAELVKAMREQAQLSQDELAQQAKVPRSVIAHLEQNRRLPSAEKLEVICGILTIPSIYWRPFTDPASIQRVEFEGQLSELCGFAAELVGQDEVTIAAVEHQITQLIRETSTDDQTRDLFNSILIYYGVPTISKDFFRRYLGAHAFSSTEAFSVAIRDYQKVAIRLFSTLSEAYRVFNESESIENLLEPLKKRDSGPYANRLDWTFISELSEDRLPDLGYISAVRVQQQATERKILTDFLTKLSSDIRRDGLKAMDSIPEKTRRKMDSFLRKFDSTIKHGLFSTLFPVDADIIEREAIRLAPKTENQIQRMRDSQATALRNLSNYLAADYMDVYVATSMREDADFVSVNQFVKKLFVHDRIRPLKLRYFNPTQSWIEDRIAKGLVEALMLRRADITIYMAQKSDSFGKDCEASVALGQGKPVIVYVPKLVVEHKGTDTEDLF